MIKPKTHFLPLNEEYNNLLKNVMSDEVLSKQVQWTRATIFDPDFIIEKIKENSKKKWNYWWICKNLPLENLLELCLIENAKLDMNGVSANINLTEKFIKDHPAWGWVSVYICANPALTPEQIINLSKIPELKIEINPPYLSKNINLTREFIDENKDIKWHFHEVTQNPSVKESYWTNPPSNFNYYNNFSDRITIEFYEKNKGYYRTHQLVEKFPLDYIINHINKNSYSPFASNWDYISLHPDLNIDFVNKNPQYPWCYRTLCLNPNINPEDMKKRYNIFLKILEDKVKELSKQEHYIIINHSSKLKSIKDYEKHEEIVKNKYGQDIIVNVQTDDDFKEEEPKIIFNSRTFEWDDLKNYDIGSIKKYLLLKDIHKIRKNLSKKFKNDRKYIFYLIKNDVSWRNLTYNPNTKLEFIFENLEQKFDWKYLSRIVKTETIEEYPSPLWDMEEHCEYADVDIEYVKNNKNIMWSWIGLSRNKNFTCKTIWENKNENWYWHIVFSYKAYCNRQLK